ncbi:CRISPR-associated ring nuclease Crn3/Csx3 [Gloeobacter kilaueensis]|uniref:ATPase involved in DNA replication n=1 Tax=Gloeobacter kilaueensis (strain ATCC BAA-2537 / CCAP 1431/1 / ULC 316 / JS1) TaxID=1183438 RepID=U5QLV5_GLOK1|nr:CRISPR-associated ring nuclease Crn3/Csx3 [Gloeobacter kilaueensis]AGY58599.1 ATPase involved in DNA replication [Gloeobacter kilaueensis JS1]
MFLSPQAKTMDLQAATFDLSVPRHWHGLHLQVLEIRLLRPDRRLEPEDLPRLLLPEPVHGVGLVISGRGPLWLYGHLVHRYHSAAWIAIYDPRLGAVVVESHVPGAYLGQVLPFEAMPPNIPRPHPPVLAPAVLVVGPPDSGKSVLAHALFQVLLTECPEVFLQRANWDGEGNYLLELGPETTPIRTNAFAAANKGTMSAGFFGYHAEAILHLRRQKALVIVDVGGMVQPEKQPLLEACSHYLIVSSRPEAVEAWHTFCRDRGNLVPVAVVHSTLNPSEIIHQRTPFLELTCGPLRRGTPVPIPAMLLDRLRSLLFPSHS